MCAFSGFRQADYPIPSDKLSDSSSGIQVHVSEGIFPELLYDMDPIDFKSVILVYPNWFGSCPMPMFTYLSHHSFEGKKVIPVCVHDGKGIGQTEKHLKAALPGARLMKGISIPGKDFPNREQDLLSSVKEALAAPLAEE